MRDVRTIAKFQVFCNVAKTLETFLKKFRRKKPMIPFLYDELVFLIKKSYEVGL